MTERTWHPPISLPKDRDAAEFIATAMGLAQVELHHPNASGFATVRVRTRRDEVSVGRISVHCGDFWPNRIGRLFMDTRAVSRNGAGAVS